MTTSSTLSFDFVVPNVCPECEQPVQAVLFVICHNCRMAWQGYEFVGDWLRRVNADTKAVWEIENALA